MNFYNLLGVPVHASDAEIKHSFRLMAKKFHPDINAAADAGDTFRMLYIAYDTLMDPFKRKIYDRLLLEDIEKEYQHYNRAYSEKMQRRADIRARQYAAMQYEEFEESVFAKVSFHTMQIVAFIMFFLMLCVGMGCLILGFHYVFLENFNGSQVAGYAIWLAAVVLSYISGKALLGIFEIWRQ